jgi:quinol monooxygenase YgiN
MVRVRHSRRPLIPEVTMPALSMRTALSVLAPALFSLGVAACGGDATTTSSSGSTASGTGGGGTGGMTTTSTTATTGSTGGAGTGGAPAVEFDAIIIGTLASTDLATAKAAHDAVAAGGESQAKMLGDFGHQALLGTTLLGTTQNQFLALDRWNTGNMDMVYGDPMFQQGFATVVSGMPSLQKYKRQPTWAGYGDLVTGMMYPTYFFAVFQGTLKDPATAQATHDAIVAGAKDMAMAAGDVAHVAFTGRDDPSQAAFIDIWKDSTAITAVYSSPAFMAAFAQVFTTQPTVGIYQSTDWHQW